MARPVKEADLSTYAGRIGAEIRRRRLAKKLTVEAAADKAGVPQKTWYNWESGRRLPLQCLPAIAAALKCRPGRLLGN